MYTTVQLMYLPIRPLQECRDVVTIGEWTDRVYTHTPPEHIITNVVSGRKMRIQASSATGLPNEPN